MSDVPDAATIATTSQPPTVVDTEGGSVTLVDLGTLRASVELGGKQNDDLQVEAQSLRALADGLWVQRGELLLSSTGQWSPVPAVADVIAQAAPLKAKLTAIDNRLADLHEEHHGRIGGFVAKATQWNERNKLVAEHALLSDQLRPLLMRMARESPSVTVANADLIGTQAQAADAQAEKSATRAQQSATAFTSMSAELRRRTEAQREMGFDSLYLAAYLNTYGPQNVESPLVLKKGEQACVSISATLARQQTRRQWVGGSQGFSFPIGHTGIRYRVGSFHGHPVQQQFLAKLDTGRLVVTNQRIAFIGNLKSTSIPLTKLLHVECYADGLAVFREGKENPDLYLVSQPKYPLIFINWFLAQNAA
jgi:hypothetical protein